MWTKNLIISMDFRSYSVCPPIGHDMLKPQVRRAPDNTSKELALVVSPPCTIYENSLILMQNAHDHHHNKPEHQEEYLRRLHEPKTL